MKKLEQQSGFTLIETIIYLLISSAILVSISYLILDIIGGQTKSFAGGEVNHNIRFISDSLAKDIRSAQDINSLIPATLVLTMPGDNITYNFDAGSLTLTRQVGSGSVENLNTDAVEATGSFADHSYNARSKNVGVTLTIEYKNPSNLSDYVASTTSIFSLELRGRR